MNNILSNNAFKSLLCVAFLAAGCSSHFKADLLAEENAANNAVTKLCEGSFIQLYANVATEVNGKNYSTEILGDQVVLEKVVGACDALMLAAPHGACAVKGNEAQFVIDDRDFENTCLQASQDLKNLQAPKKSDPNPVPLAIKSCSGSFIKLYEAVEKLVSDKDYDSEIKKDAIALKNIVKACDALLLLAPYGECKIEQSQSGTVISDFDFENLCLDASADLATASADSPKDQPRAPFVPPQVETAGQAVDLLKTDVLFQIKTTNPPAMATLINSQKLRNNYILYFVAGTRLTHSPTTDQIGIGCSVYTGTPMTGADLSKPMSLSKKSITSIASGVVILFAMNANGKTMNLQCFKKVTAGNPTFTLNDVRKHLGTYFQVLQK